MSVSLWDAIADSFTEQPPDPYLQDPAGWAKTKLAARLWSKQREIAEALVVHKKVVVKASHSVGKSYLAGVLAAWWLDTHILGEAFVASCYTEDTEVLTRTGWKLFKDVTVGPDGDEFATRNQTTRQFEWQHAFQYHEAPWDGEVVDITARSLHLRVTPNHRMLVRWADQKNSGETFKPAEKITRRGAEIPALSEWEGKPSGKVQFGKHEWDTVTFAKFLGAWIAEGSLGPPRKHVRRTYRWVPGGPGRPPGRTGRVVAGPIDLTQLPNTKGYEPYKELLIQMFGSEPARSQGKSWRMNCKELWNYLRSLGKAGDKYIPTEVKSWGRVELAAFLGFYLLGDGWRRPGGQWKSVTVSKRLADDLQEIAQKVGMFAPIKARQPRDASIGGRKIPAENCRVQYEVAFCTSERRSVSASRSHYTGKVYCVSVPNEVLYVRRNGSPIWCGNTAPTYPQVHAILWEEIRKQHRRGRLMGRVLQSDEWKTDNGTLIGYGRKPADTDQHAFQGIHRKYVLAIIDESCGVPEQLFTAVEAITTSDDCRILAIGNPDDPNTEFGKICKPGSGWHVITINAASSPNFTGERVPDHVRDGLVSVDWVEDKKLIWGESSPRYVSKVLGEFPDIGEDTLIRPGWIEAAQQYEGGTSPDPILAVDVARMGSDRTILGLRTGQKFRVVGDYGGIDTMTTVGHVIQAIREYDVAQVRVDVVGVGAGVVDRLIERGVPVVEMQSGGAPLDPEQFLNARAEWWWGLRERFEQGHADIDPDDDQLAAQLGAMKWKPTSRGQVQVELKDDMKKRGLPSPDRGDTLMMAFAHVPAWGDTFTADDLTEDDYDVDTISIY